MNTQVAAPPLAYGPPISLETASRVVEAARAHAQANGWAMVIAVTDAGGHLVLLQRMDHATHGSVEVAQRKATTAAAFKRATKGFEETLASGGATLRLLSMHNAILMDGGIPLIEDGQVAEAGARMLNG